MAKEADEKGWKAYGLMPRPVNPKKPEAVRCNSQTTSNDEWLAILETGFGELMPLAYLMELAPHFLLSDPLERVPIDRKPCECHAPRTCQVLRREMSRATLLCLDHVGFAQERTVTVWVGDGQVCRMRLVAAPRIASVIEQTSCKVP